MDLKLQSWPLRVFVVIFSVVFALLAACLLIGIFAAPRVAVTEVSETFPAQEGKYEMFVDEFSSKNQELAFYVRGVTDPLHETIIKTLQLRVIAEGRATEADEWERVRDKDMTVRFHCVDGSSECSEVRLFFLPFIRYAEYHFVVSLVEGDAPDWLLGVQFEWEYVNPAFTVFEGVSRLHFFLLTVGFLLYFAYSVRGYSVQDWAVEQKWTVLLALFLLGLNDPFFALSIRFWFFDLLDQLLASSFLAVLLLFWLIMFHSLLVVEPEERTFKHFYAPKLGLVALFWLFLTLFYLGIEIWDESHPAVIVFGVFTALSFVVYMGWLVYLGIKLVPQINAQIKIKVFFYFTIAVIVITVCGVVFGALGPLAESGVEILAFFGLFNYYVYTLMLLYLPASSNAAPRGLDRISIGSSDGEDLVASDLDFGSETDFEISLTDVGIQRPERFSPIHDEDDDDDF